MGDFRGADYRELLDLQQCISQPTVKVDGVWTFQGRLVSSHKRIPHRDPIFVCRYPVFVSKSCTLTWLKRCTDECLARSRTGVSRDSLACQGGRYKVQEVDSCEVSRGRSCATTRVGEWDAHRLSSSPLPLCWCEKNNA